MFGDGRNWIIMRMSTQGTGSTVLVSLPFPSLNLRLPYLVNWYRTRSQNFQDELSLPNKTITCPVLYVSATKDIALKPFMARNMHKQIKELTFKSVKTGHWALWEKPEEVNGFIREWLGEMGLTKQGRSKL
jgi:pimeloyl-ACP methyl ester carboxylesterase